MNEEGFKIWHAIIVRNQIYLAFINGLEMFH